MLNWNNYKKKTDGVIQHYDLSKRSVRLSVVLIYVIVSVICLAFIYPLVWLLFSCFKSNNELVTNTGLIPWEFDFEGLMRTWTKLDYGNSYFYSLVICAGSVFCAVVFNGLAGFALACIKFRGSKLIWGLMMTLMLIPSTGAFVVLYRNMVTLGMTKGQLWPLFLGAGGSCYNIMLFKTYFENIPKDYLDAARIDGCSDIGIFFRMILPLSKPIASIVAINAFLGAWSDFLMPYLCLMGSDKSTVMVKLFLQVGKNGVVMDQLRASMFTIIPPIIFFLIFQKNIMNNNTGAGVKG